MWILDCTNEITIVYFGIRVVVFNTTFNNISVYFAEDLGAQSLQLSAMGIIF